jgi:hypothetical protein
VANTTVPLSFSPSYRVKERYLERESRALVPTQTLTSAHFHKIATLAFFAKMPLFPAVNPPHARFQTDLTFRSAF